MKKIYLLTSTVFFLTLGICEAQFKDLYDFKGTSATQGSVPNGDLTISGSIMYGMTSTGGSNNQGNIFSINIDGTGYTDILNFNGTNGSLPNGDLTLSGSVLYGMTSKGGANGEGLIFSVNTDGTGYKNLLDFNGTNGSNPNGSLILSAGVLYGMTAGNVNPNVGNVFLINTDGTGFKDLIDFKIGGPAIYAEAPMGSLILSGSILYGMASLGGVNDEGTVFSIHTDGTGYTDILDFNGTNGAHPQGSLILSGNVLYGMTENGGGNSDGNVFSVHTDGTGYADLLQFTGTNGANPYGSLILVGNVLYGITTNGGINTDGNIFSIHTDGTGYQDLVDFNGANGASPMGSLTLSGNVLYGMASTGYANPNYWYGNVFSLSGVTGVVEQNSLTDLGMNVFPNPASANSSVHCSVTSKTQTQAQLCIVDLLGRTVTVETIQLTTGLNTTELTVSSLTNGTYLLRITSTDGGFMQSKLVIE